jgi:hypothetical protein
MTMGINGFPMSFYLFLFFISFSFFYSFFKPILIIEKEQIIYNDSFRTKVFQYRDITGISRFAGDYTFITGSDKFTVNKQSLDKESIEKPDSFLDQFHF